MIEVLAPAKLNLGLEVLGRRDDGLHEVRSVMAAVSLADRVTIAPSGQGRLLTGGLPVEASGNLVCDAVSVACSKWGLGPVEASLTKRIPLSSGLGGGSSDAAAALLALAELAGADPSTLGSMAARIGSDVPFFLAGATAHVAGRGDLVTATPPHAPLHAVIVVPGVTIPRKTATMYARLTAEDLSDGAAVSEIASDVSGLPGRAAALPNAFRRPLHALVPDLRAFAARIEASTSLPANVTGAGPAHFVLCRDPEHAAGAARRLRTAFDRSVSVFVVRSMAGIQMREVAGAGRDA